MDLINSAKHALDSLRGDKAKQDLSEGGLDGVALLTAQHREVDSLFAAYAEAGDHAYRTKEKIFEEIARKLESHTLLEETVFYPAAARFDADLIREAREEHDNVKEMLAKIDELAAEDSTFDAKVKVLQELVHHHVSEEEGELFPECKKNMDRETLQSLGAQMEKLAKKSASTKRKSGQAHH